MSGSGISWAICKSAPRSRQITMPAPHHSVFYRPDALPAAQPTAPKHWRQWAITQIERESPSAPLRDRKCVIFVTTAMWPFGQLSSMDFGHFLNTEWIGVLVRRLSYTSEKKRFKFLHTGLIVTNFWVISRGTCCTELAAKTAQILAMWIFRV